MRRPVVAGNWKMHMGPEATKAFLQAFQPSAEKGGSPRFILFPPSLSVTAAVAAQPLRPVVEIGVQNIHWEPSGAFTGEISAPMAREAGATLALVGHSERRHLFGETDEETALKARAALRYGLTPVVCVGETLSERRSGQVEAVLLRQLEAVLPAFEKVSDAEFLLAYEPVWAIGTGETATPNDASAAHRLLRSRLAAALGEARAEAVSILYGGSVKPENAGELLRAPDVDGVLVGGASLDPESFAAIGAAAPIP